LKQKYIVVSYDPDEQQWFYDVVFAEDSDAAVERICCLRDYVIAADALSVADMEQMTGSLASATEAKSEIFLKELEA
jgi:hypothetical protein